MIFYKNITAKTMPVRFFCQFAPANRAFLKAAYIPTNWRWAAYQPANRPFLKAAYTGLKICFSLNTKTPIKTDRKITLSRPDNKNHDKNHNKNPSDKNLGDKNRHVFMPVRMPHHPIPFALAQ